ncbi:MAG: hypothetical protein GXP31_17435 [Kiritimatiellaeota bacterium]|nr:hypothetical protein [Kiritimatiellota bacterium]
MPAGYARPDSPVTIWGTLDFGTFAPPPAGTTYTWTFQHDDAVSMALDPGTPLSGAVADCRNISVTCTFSLGSAATSAWLLPTLTVSGPGGEGRAMGRLRVVSTADPLSDTQQESLEIERRIALDKALHWLFLRQAADGSWPYKDAAACTATVLWAFENAGHTPDADPAVDVYQGAVKAAIEYILGASEYMPIAVTVKGDPDADGNGRGILLAKNRTPAVTGAGMTGALGVDGYTHAMCLAALCASGTPDYVTHTAPFDNAGAGTPLLDIVQDAADFDVWKLGRSGSGGWSYAYTDSFWVDMSIASWNYVALEAVRQFGAVIPAWATVWCENLLSIAYVPNKGLFSYQTGAAGPSNASAATTASGLSGLILVTDNTRAPGIDAGKTATQTLAQIGTLWRDLGRNTYAFFGDTYQMWTVARALRMAGVTHLNTPDGRFDWQRNLAAPGDVHEGFRPYLVRTQRPDGHWEDAGVFHYPDELTTAWAILCLSEGVIGPDAVWRDVEVTVSLPADTGNELAAGSFAEQGPHVSTNGSERRLTWFIGDVSEGRSFDLSFDQILDRIVPGEFRRVQNSLTVSCFTRRSQFVEDVRGPLGVSVAPSLYSLTVTADRDAYALGDTARFTVDLDLPKGQRFQRIASPITGRYVLEPDLADPAASWTVLEFDVLNSEAFDAADRPVAIRVRSAPTRAALAQAAFSAPITTPGQNIPCPTGRLLELDVALTANAAGVVPEIGFVTVWYNTGPARVFLDVRAPDGAVADTPAAFNLFPGDYGTTLRRSVEWTVRNLPSDSRGTVRARLILRDDAPAATASDDFDVTAADPAGVLDTALAANNSTYPPHTGAVFTTVLRNLDAERVLEDLRIVLDLLDPQNRPVADGRFSFRVPRLVPGGETVHSVTWNTQDHTPGTWRVRQVVTDTNGTLLATTEINVAIGGNGALQTALAGQIETRPRTIVHPARFAVDWTVENRGNATLRNFRIQLTISPEPGARSRGWRSLAQSEEIAELAVGDSITGTWANLPSSDLPEGPYLALFEAIQGRGNPTALDTAPLTVRDRPTDTVPPTTVHDYASDGTWINHDARITLTAADNPGGSGVKHTSWTLGGVTTTGTTITVSSEGISVVTFRSEDKVGNLETDSALTIKIDKTAPTVTAALHPAPNANGWNNSDVTVTFQAADMLSGIQSVTSPVTISSEGAGQAVAGRATDAAGNVATLTATVNIDRTTPVLTVAGVTDGQVTNRDVIPVVAVLEDHPDANSFALDGQPFVSGTRVRTEGLHTLRITAVDLAGNTATQTVRFTIDRTPPTTTHDYASAGVWVNHDVHIALVAIDNPGGSGVKKTSWTLRDITTASAIITVPDEGVATIAFRSEDNAGNIEPDRTVTTKVDKTPPVLTARCDPAPNANGWNNTAVTVFFAATDALSGVSYVTGARTVSAEGTNLRVAGNAADLAGNTAETTVVLNIDTTAPAIRDRSPGSSAVDVPPDATVSAILHDDLSGIGTGTIRTELNGTLVAHTFAPLTGLLIITGGQLLPGEVNSAEVTVEDAAGNRSEAQWSFTVRRNEPARLPVLFGNPSDSHSIGVVLAGLGTAVRGAIHSNGDVRITGRSLRIEGRISATGRVRMSGLFDGGGQVAEQCTLLPFPRFAPQAYLARAQFVHDRSLVLRTQASLPEGIHFVRGDVLILGPVHAHATIVAEGDIMVFSRNARIEPFDTENDMLFFALGRRVCIAGVSNSLTGLIYAPDARIEAGGRFNRFEQARIYGRRILVTASRTTIAGPPATRQQAVGHRMPFAVMERRVVPQLRWTGRADAPGFQGIITPLDKGGLGGR